MTAPNAAEVPRIAIGRPEALLCLFDVEALAEALPWARAACAAGLAPLAVRGRAVPGGALDAFDELWLGDGLAPLLPPATWTHPVVVADALAEEGTAALGVVFSRLPEPGLLDLADVGRAGLREAAPPAALAAEPGDVEALLATYARGGATRALLVDTGGDAATVAAAIGPRLGAWFGPARRPVPADVPVAHVWCEPEDALPPAPAPWSCAWLPVAMAGDDPAAATARVEQARALGYAAVAPRFHRPVPNTAEWAAMNARLRGLDDRDPVFECAGFSSAMPREWTRANRYPPLAARRRTWSLGAVREALQGYTAEARREPPLTHARELITEALRGDASLSPVAEYPFLAVGGRTLLEHVDAAIEARLRTLDGVPEPLLRAVQHTALAGGKRIRPVLALALAATHRVPLDVALPPALAIEWLHTASLIQDDLPCMDDEAVRRRQPAVHRRHGEGLALLASDALVALAFEDVAALAADARVGPGRAAAMVAKLAQALGARGLVGGQALDLALRGDAGAELADVLEVHRRKTVPLFRLAAALPAILADLPAAEVLEAHLGDLGLAFQIVDDLLDGGEGLGRPGGSDARHGRPTFATLADAEVARRMAARLLTPLLGEDAVGRLARFVLDRR